MLSPTATCCISGSPTDRAGGGAMDRLYFEDFPPGEVIEYGDMVVAEEFGAGDE